MHSSKYKENHEKHKKMRVGKSLAFIGTCNWDLWVCEDNKLHSIPKDENPDCKPSAFGDKNHIRRLMSQGYFSDKPTEAGLKLMNGLHSKICTQHDGKQFTILSF